jgi:hypothetical protein
MNFSGGEGALKSHERLLGERWVNQAPDSPSPGADCRPRSVFLQD